MWIQIILTLVSALAGGGLASLLMFGINKKQKQVEIDGRVADQWKEFAMMEQRRAERSSAKNAELWRLYNEVENELVKCSILYCDRKECPHRQPPLGEEYERIKTTLHENRTTMDGFNDIQGYGACNAPGYGVNYATPGYRGEGYGPAASGYGAAPTGYGATAPYGPVSTGVAPMYGSTGATSGSGAATPGCTTAPYCNNSEPGDA